MLDPLSGRVLRQVDMNITSPFDHVPCQEGVVFVNGGVALVPAADGARMRPVGRTSQLNRFIALVQRDSTVFAYGRESIMALRRN